MAYQRTRDILDEVRAFHGKLARCYQGNAGLATDERARLLLDYMGRHEERLERFLAAYEEVTAKRILDTWFKFTPDLSAFRSFEELELTPDMTVDDIIRTAMEYDERLRTFYQGMAERAVSVEVRELFESLMHLEQQDEHNTVRSAMSFADD